MNVDICGEQSISETLLKLAEYQRELLGRKENEKKSATLLSISEAACVWGHKQFCKAPNRLQTCGLRNYKPRQ